MNELHEYIMKKFNLGLEVYQDMLNAPANDYSSYLIIAGCMIYWLVLNADFSFFKNDT